MECDKIEWLDGCVFDCGYWEGWEFGVGVVDMKCCEGDWVVGCGFELGYWLDFRFRGMGYLFVKGRSRRRGVRSKGV